MAAESSRSNSTADSYIGSLISLTSKSEIRYEGILYNINTDESSIGLRNVRSFGTEGRKKDGPQVMPSDKVYEYILFRGSDIKDLQVKSSPPVQSTQTINSDPAIIQSHYPHPTSTTSSLPAASSVSLTELSPHPSSSFQGGVPLYQPGGNLGSWGPTPPQTANGSGLPMPMYWPGFYGPLNGVPQMHQQSLLRPPPNLSMPPPSMQQPMQYPGFNTSLPSGPSNLPEYPSFNPMSKSLPTSSLSLSLPLESQPGVLPNQGSSSTTSVGLPSASLLTAPSSDLNANIPPVSNRPNVNSPYQAFSQPMSSFVGTSVSARTETTTPLLITPGQLLQSGQAAASSTQLSQTSHKDVEVVQVYPATAPAHAPASASVPAPASAPAPAPAKASAPALLSEPPVPVPTAAQPPILPLPTPLRPAQKMNGAAFHSHHSYRGRGRGRGPASSRPVMKFTEEFDFMAMNEKFNKDEVWGHLGKSSKDKEGEGNGSDEYESEDEDYSELPKVEVKPVYSKDDFFDTLSSNALDNQSYSGRTRFSEQMKIDTETFGEFSRYRGGRGGRGYGRGGRSRGGSYYGRGYGYNGRGRGWNNMPARDF